MILCYNRIVMANFIRDYTEDIGLVSVIVLSSNSTYVKDKLNVIEEIICFKSGRPYLMTVKWMEGSKGKFNYKIRESKRITEDEYRKFLINHT